MAFSAKLYDEAPRLRYLTTNANNVPLVAPFEMLTIDGTFQAYELLPGTEALCGPDGRFPSRNYVGAVWLSFGTARLPIAKDGDVPVFEYHGI